MQTSVPCATCVNSACAQLLLARMMSFSVQNLNRGFCWQDDLLYESLTVYETLYYAAMLRLPQHMDHKAKIDRVETVITALGLSSCKDTIIGKP